MGNARFARSKPRLADSLPDASVFDIRAHGSERSLLMPEGIAMIEKWQGFVDSVSENRVAGWAARGKKPCSVDLRVEDTLIFSTPACLAREDLKAHFKNGTRAFVVEVPLAYCDGKERTVKICFGGTELCLTGGEFRFRHSAQFKPIHTFVDPDPSIAVRARQILTLLKPRSVLGGSMIRVGRPNDGGYVMLEHALNNVPAYSIGISNDVSWDLEMVKRGCTIFQYDHTIERLPVEHDNFRWEKFGIAGATSADRRLLSMEDLLERNNHIHNDNLILKMDAEGSEWDVLEKVANSTLGKFSQVIMELHCLERLGTTADYELIYFGLHKLAETHQLVHVHANNCGWLCVLGGVPLPSAVEVAYVRRSDHNFDVCHDLFPTPLDMPCRADVADIYLGPLGLLPDAFDHMIGAPSRKI